MCIDPLPREGIQCHYFVNQEVDILNDILITK